MEILLSKSTMPIIGWIAQLLGWIMNGIYIVLDAIGIPNIGLAIIFYTIIVYMLMTPLQVKQAVVGYGKAVKTQVQEMTKQLLNLKAVPKPDDVADALAIAICHAHTAPSLMNFKKFEEWK